MPATARFHGVTQQDSAEVGIHGIRERLQFFVEESPGARNKGVRVWLPKYIYIYMHTSTSIPRPQSPRAPVPLWMTSLNRMISLFLSLSTMATVTIYCAKYNDLTSSFDHTTDSSYYYDTHFIDGETEGQRRQ